MREWFIDNVNQALESWREAQEKVSPAFSKAAESRDSVSGRSQQ